MQNYKTYL